MNEPIEHSLLTCYSPFTCGVSIYFSPSDKILCPFVTEEEVDTLGESLEDAFGLGYGFRVIDV